MERMNSRERVRAALARQTVDYVPCCGHFNPLLPRQRQGYSWNFPWPETAGQEEQVAFQAGQLGLDAPVHTGLVLTRTADGVESEVRLDGDALRKTYRTAAGELTAAVRYNDLWAGGMDVALYDDLNVGHFVEPWIKEPADLERLKQLQVPLTLDEVLAESRERVGAALALARRYGLPTVAHVGMGLTGAQHLFGVEGICLAVSEQPDLVAAYIAHEHRINMTGIRAAAALGIDIVRRNGFYETADFYGPAMLERFLKKSLDEEAAAARAAGMATSYTVHTGVMPILDYLAALGFDSFFGLDTGFHGVDLAAVRGKLAGAKALWTGPSSTYHLWKGPEATRQAVRDVFDCFGRTGLLLTPCVSSHSIMPWESTLAMVDEWKRLR